ncbi:hypothetical protein HPULCUR_010200 [Helicostylum pulchrum]|uniref:Uncharacterized protein n=1 Tax=Helicostylum pulchrum TaxID=562976 RepID=A0ABP9YEJ4_9FUNG
MSTPVETNIAAATAPVIEVPPKDETPAVINVDDHVVHTETVTTTREPTAATTKVTPAQRLSSVFTKARQTVTDAVSDAQKALNERKANNQAATTATATATATTPAPAPAPAPTPADTTTATTEAVVNSAPEDKKVGGPNNTFKGILNRVKGLKPATNTHPTVAEAAVSTEDTTAPVPPPKDSTKETNPVFEQFKRNTTLLSNYLLQKKKGFTEKKSSDTNQQQTTTTPELHSETGDNKPPPTNGSSPLVRRITQLVQNATASINKKKNTDTDNADIVPPTVVNASSPAVTSAA